jgi:hypothetical protein
MIYTPPPRHAVAPVVVTTFSREMAGDLVAHSQAPSSSTIAGGIARLFPVCLLEPYPVAKLFWCNGSTVGTDSIDVGVYRMTDLTTGRLDLIRSTGAILSAGASVVQASSTWKVAANAAAITTGRDSTDATTYTTASVTLKAGRLYLLSFVNTAADAAAISSIAGGPTWTSRSTTQYNTTAHRVSIWSGVPSVDYTGTIVVTFGATQTGGRWSLNEFSGVDTATTDGVVQNAVGTGSSTTPLATLAAFGSANNATFGALANTADNSTTPGAGFTELSDFSTSTTPASFLQTEWRVDNDTTVDGTITSGQWGACAVELKASTSSLVVPPCTPGAPAIYFAWVVSGGTATFLRKGTNREYTRLAGIIDGPSSTFPLPSTMTPQTLTNNFHIPLAGFSLRTLLD